MGTPTLSTSTLPSAALSLSLSLSLSPLHPLPIYSWCLRVLCPLMSPYYHQPRTALIATPHSRQDDKPPGPTSITLSPPDRLDPHPAHNVLLVSHTSQLAHLARLDCSKLPHCRLPRQARPASACHG